MGGLNSLKLSQRFALLIGVFVLGFAVYGGWSFKTLNDLKVNGPLYQRIVQGKDLVADILPPPEYILESYLVTLQLAGEADAGEQNRLIDKLKALKGDYDTRHTFWAGENLGGELDDVFLKQAHAPALEFYQTVFASLVPAVQRGDREALAAAMPRLKQAYETHRQAIDRVVDIANQRMAADEGSAKARIDSATLLLLGILGVSVAAGMAVAAAIIRGLLASLGGEPEYAVRIARAIADCDLTIPVATRPGDQSSLLAAMKTMQASLVATIGSVNRSVDQLALSAAQLTQSASRVAETANQQNASTQSMAAAMEEISTSIEKISDNARETEQNTLASGEISQHGLGMVYDATDEMNRIAEAVSHSAQHIGGLGSQSGEISAIVNAIKEIADQTNLLALNAAIEAARAGEQGRGFAVVADEVRKLAERTSRSTQQISEMIGGIERGTQGAVDAMGDVNARMSDGVRMVDRVRQSIEKIKTTTDSVIGEVRGMTDALREQSSAHGLVAGNVSLIAEQTEQTSQEVDAIAEAAQALEALSATLKASVTRFRMA